MCFADDDVDGIVSDGYDNNDERDSNDKMM